jgi:nucleotide-binding universal stress UspA family protein|uniref:Universal stress protein n=1 Tax=Desulfobacca acetoxidans TaxID=60893 RepID=A0A7C3WHT7_9BACT
MFRKILVPLDGSELASRILPQVAALAEKFGSELTLLHVCPAATSAQAPEAAVQRKICEAYLSLLAKELQSQGLEIHPVCIEGGAPWEILRYAEEHKMDLIAMATHGKGEIAWLIGSTAEKVITHASVPVMLFRIFFKEVPPLKGQIREFV